MIKRGDERRGGGEDRPRRQQHAQHTQHQQGDAAPGDARRRAGHRKRKRVQLGVDESEQSEADGGAAHQHAALALAGALQRAQDGIKGGHAVLPPSNNHAPGLTTDRRFIPSPRHPLAKWPGLWAGGGGGGGGGAAGVGAAGQRGRAPGRSVAKNRSPRTETGDRARAPAICRQRPFTTNRIWRRKSRSSLAPSRRARSAAPNTSANRCRSSPISTDSPASAVTKSGNDHATSLRHRRSQRPTSVMPS